MRESSVELLDATAFRALAEAVPEAIPYLRAPDDDGTVLYVGPRVETILGFGPDEWASDPALWIWQLHPLDRDRVVAEFRESSVTGAPFRSEYRMLTRDGGEVWLRDEAVLARHEDGRRRWWRGVMVDVTAKKRAEQRLDEGLQMLRTAIDERRALMALLDEVQERERARIAEDIHDDPVQVMSAVAVRLQVIVAEETDAKRRRELQELRGDVALAVARLRHLIFELRPPAVEGGLGATVRDYLERALGSTGLAYEVEDRLPGDVSLDVRAVLFRVAREAITNVRKHAGATGVRVALWPEEGGVVLSVTDDGRGFDRRVLDRPEPGHLGLPTIRERAEAAGGWCRIETAPGAGTTVECWIPTGEPSQAAPSAGRLVDLPRAAVRPRPARG